MDETRPLNPVGLRIMFVGEHENGGFIYALGSKEAGWNFWRAASDGVPAGECTFFELRWLSHSTHSEIGSVKPNRSTFLTHVVEIHAIDPWEFSLNLNAITSME